MNSPLDLEEYFFPVVQVVANPDAPEEEDVNQLDFGIKTHLRKSASDDVYQMSVEISSPPKDDDEVNQAYKINLLVVGIFRVHPEWEDPENY